MKAKIAGWFCLNGATENKTSSLMWLHVLLAAALSFLPVLYFLEFGIIRDGWYALVGIFAFAALKYMSRDMLFHPVIVYSFIWIGAAMAVYLRLTIMPVFWLTGYYLIAVGLFLPKTEFTRSKARYTEEFIDKQIETAKKIRPFLVAAGIAMIAAGPFVNF